MLGEDVLGTGSSRTTGAGLDGASASPKESLVGSEKLPPTAVGTVALSLPLPEGVGELELAVVFILFGSGTEDLDGVLGTAGIVLVGCFGAARGIWPGVVQLLPLDGFTAARVVTLAASTSSGTPMFNRSSSTDSTGVVGKARPEGADDEVERVLFEGTGLRPARVEELGRDGRTGTILEGSGLMGVGGVVCFVLSVC